jgi:hypothetical protein
MSNKMTNHSYFTQSQFASGEYDVQINRRIYHAGTIQKVYCKYLKGIDNKAAAVPDNERWVKMASSAPQVQCNGVEATHIILDDFKFEGIVIDDEK